MTRGTQIVIVAAFILIPQASRTQQSASNTIPIVYQSPIPDAQYVLPTTTIVLCPSESFASTVHLPSRAFKVVGSKSGLHSGRVIFSDDNREVIFEADERFAFAETVSVAFSGGVATVSGQSVIPTSFRFFTGKQVQSNIPLTPQSLMQGSELGRVSGPMAPNSQGQGSPEETIQSSSPPPDFPHINISQSGATAPGYLFLATNGSPSSGSYLMIVDDGGNPVWCRKTDSWCLDFKIQPTGQLTYLDMGRDQFYVLDATYSVVDSVSCGNGYLTDWHELRLLPNGHALILGDDRELVDMSAIVPGGNPNAVVIGNIIQELDSQKNVVFEWRSWDHFQITDATHEDLTASQIDYVHSNALELDVDGNIILSSRHLDEITKIDRSTGQIIWRWGGKHNQFTMVNDSLGFSHQHAVRLLAYGDFVLFDNGNYHTPSLSRAVEYSVDERNRTATLVWQYRNTPDIYGNAMGYVQRLPGGNTLVCWGTASTVTEIAPTGSKIFQLTFDPGIYTYRAYRYVWNLETDVASPATIPTSTSLFQNYPNPFNGQTTLQFSLLNPATVSLKIYDILGRQVMSVLDGVQRFTGQYFETVDFTFLPSGVYFCRLTANSFSQVRKLVLAK